LGSLFIEAGTVGLLDDNEKFDTGIDPVTGEQLTEEAFYTRTIDDLDLRAMAGASVFWESPFGPIRFDFTKPLRQFDYDDRQSFQFTKQQEMKITEAKAVQKVQERLRTILKTIVAERNADVVLERSLVIYGDPVDVTDTVISRLNGQMKTVPVTRERLPRKS